MDTVGTGRSSQFRLSERQLGWRLPCPRRGRGPSISGTRFILVTPRTSRAERPRSERSYVVGVQYHLVWSDSLLSHLPSLGTGGSVPCTPRCRLLLDPVLRLLRRNSSVNRGSSFGAPGLRCAPPRSHTLIPTHAQHTSCRAEVCKAYAPPNFSLPRPTRKPLAKTSYSYLQRPAHRVPVLAAHRSPPRS